MREFDYVKLKEQLWDCEILSYVAQIHEYKGRQELYIRQKPVGRACGCARASWTTRSG